MKKEGRKQHGVVKRSVILPAQINPMIKTRAFNQFDSHLSSGSVARASSKATKNIYFGHQSKSSTWTDCHVHPIVRSKEKTKGFQKSKSVLNVVMNNRISDKGKGINYRGASATEILGQLGENEYWNDQLDYDDDDSYDEGENENENENVLGEESKEIAIYFVKEANPNPSSPDTGIEDDEDYKYNYNYNYNHSDDSYDDGGKENENVLAEESKEIAVHFLKEENPNPSSPDTGIEDEDDDHMSFCDVGYVVDYLDGDEDWCLVEEM